MVEPSTAAPPDADLIPPAEMLHDGTTTREQFTAHSETFATQVLIPRTHLLPTAAILDAGCGNGAIARALTRYLFPEGRYVGFDVNPRTVAWLQERYQRFPNFSFVHANVWSSLYNPDGARKAADYRFPFEDASFDVVLLNSVFTHMLPADVKAYLRQISRVLKPGGRAAITYFLLNSDSRPLIEQGRDVHRVRFEYEGDPRCWVANPAIPEAVVAHDEARIRGFYAELGMHVIDLSFGDWCGRPTLLGHQDLIVAQKG